MGNLGPFVQGSPPSLTIRLRVAAALAIAFLSGALVIFALAYFLGGVLQMSEVPLSWRRGVGVVSLVALASLDLLAIKKADYCPLSWRRQTPRALMFRYKTVTRTAAAWGFDTGLAVTTFRVAALTWGALMFAFLGLAEWWIGIAYGLGFVVPLMLLLWTHRLGRPQSPGTNRDPGMKELLKMRTPLQFASATLLAVGGVVLLFELLNKV